MSHTDVMNASNAILDEVERAIVGKRSVLELILIALLADGHVLLEDVPGVAKTAIARAFAEAAGLSFSRVQFTPDLIPADITGSAVLTNFGADAEFKPGPVFANLVLGDEINRAPPKTQSALLEAMEERQVTADGVTHPLPTPFLVVGTQNPIEQEGTYPLPEAQLDRFLIRTGIGYPGTEAEVTMVLNRARRGTERLALNPVLRAGELSMLQKRVEEVHIAEPVAHYVVNVVEATRTSPRTEAGASPRGSLGLLKAARARAALSGRSFVLPDDIKALAIPVLAHRLILHPDQWVRGVQAEHVVTEVLQQVPAPVGADDPTRPDSSPPIQQQPPHQGPGQYAAPQYGGATPPPPQFPPPGQY
ncbi:MAG: MoxR family ATPase [Acidimicrobiales bacterium]